MFLPVRYINRLEIFHWTQKCLILLKNFLSVCLFCLFLFFPFMIRAFASQLPHSNAKYDQFSLIHTLNLVPPFNLHSLDLSDELKLTMCPWRQHIDNFDQRPP